MGKKKVDFMCTAFRDGFQSVYGARVFTKDFMPAVAAAREAGITHFEVPGALLLYERGRIRDDGRVQEGRRT